MRSLGSAEMPIFSTSPTKRLRFLGVPNEKGCSKPIEQPFFMCPCGKSRTDLAPYCLTRSFWWKQCLINNLQTRPGFRYTNPTSSRQLQAAVAVSVVFRKRGCSLQKRDCHCLLPLPTYSGYFLKNPDRLAIIYQRPSAIADAPGLLALADFFSSPLTYSSTTTSSCDGTVFDAFTNR